MSHRDTECTFQSYITSNKILTCRIGRRLPDCMQYLHVSYVVYIKRLFQTYYQPLDMGKRMKCRYQTGVYINLSILKKKNVSKMQ